MKKKHALIVFLALTLAVATVLPSAWAYFTANAQATGGRTVELSRHTEIEESFADWTKVLTLRANPVTRPVWARARGYVISDVALEYTGEGWTDGGDGWWYYGTPLANSGEGVADPSWTVREAQPLTIHINIQNVPPHQLPDDFDVSVVYETVPVTYHEDGSRVELDDVDWDPALIVRGKEDAV